MDNYGLCLIKATEKVFYYIKYYVGYREIKEKPFVQKRFLVSKDNISWVGTKFVLVPTNIWIEICYNLDTHTSNVIQNYLDRNTEPFIALRYLHSAMNEERPSFEWIDATIAAELAIKEFLIRKNPEMKVLVLEVPSPPLDKLYGSVLESLTGQRSPVLNEIRKGATMRNTLVHKPLEVAIEEKEAHDYVKAVETAIYHLIYLLYPEDPFAGQRYRQCLANINNKR